VLYRNYSAALQRHVYAHVTIPAIGLAAIMVHEESTDGLSVVEDHSREPMDKFFLIDHFNNLETSRLPSLHAASRYI
jgi:hypothetical protein